MSFEIIHKLRRFFEGLPREHQGYSLDYIPSPYDPRDYKYSLLIGAEADETVTLVDYRPNLPPVFDQGQRGSCVACASAWTLKAYEELKQGDYPQDGLSAAFLYSMCKQNDGMPSEEGTQPKTAMQVLKKYGICPEDIMPYSTLTDLTAPKVPDVPTTAIGAAVDFKIETYAQLCSAYDLGRSQLLSSMRQALKNEGPFLMALVVCENFEPDKNNRLPVPEGQVRGGHAVGIAGDLPEQECLILRNSWGSGWGDNGYAYLPYEWLSAIGYWGWSVLEAWTATDIKTSEPAGQITITPGLKYMMVDGKRVGLEQSSILKNGSAIMAPITEIANSMGYKVEWDGRKLVLNKQI